MTRPSLLLFEVLDLPGARAGDAVLRLAALERAGFAASAVVVGDCAGVPSAPRVGHAHDLAAALAIARRSGPACRIVVASGAAGGGALGARLGPASGARWWPTAAARPRVRWWTRSPEEGRLRSLDPDPRGPLHTALAWAVADTREAIRPRLPLWDGDYVLVPAPPSPAGARAIVDAFAAVADDGVALDLVILSSRAPEALARARALGLGIRVHAAGTATGVAEWAWLADAGAVVVDAGAPLAAGLVARALASGVVPRVAGAGADADTMRAWLASVGVVRAASEAALGAATLAGSLAARTGAGRGARATGVAPAPDAPAAADRARPAAGIGRRPAHALAARLAAALGGPRLAEAA